MKTVIEISKKMKIPVHKIYDEIRAGRVESVKKNNRVYVTDEGLKSFKEREKTKKKLTPLREYLKKINISVSQYYRKRYMGCELHGLVKIGGRLFIKEND